MNTDKLSRFWLVAAFLLILIIIIGSAMLWMRRGSGQPVDISSPSVLQSPDKISIEGSIINPGVYPLKAGDSIESLIKASGGLNETADPSQIRLYIPQAGEGISPQKVDINRAEAWLLQSLPGIGEVRAQAIVDYRKQQGYYHNTKELTSVPGISDATFNKIKDLITVTE